MSRDFHSIDLYRNCAVPLVAIADDVWRHPGAAGSASAVPFWGHLYKQRFDVTGKRTRIIAVWSIEWSQGLLTDANGNKLGGIQFGLVENGVNSVLAEISQDRDPLSDPETVGIWVSTQLQDLIDRGVNAVLTTNVRGAAKFYGIHLYYFTWIE